MHHTHFIFKCAKLLTHNLVNNRNGTARKENIQTNCNSATGRPAIEKSSKNV